MKILLFGATGLFGTNFIYNFSNIYEITSVLNNKILNFKSVNKYLVKNNLNYREITDLVSAADWDIIINAAAMTNIENCQKKKDLAFKVNKDLAVNLSIASQKENKKYIFISTDSLHSGQNTFDNESSKVEPINTYAKSKAEAEKEILENSKNSLIIRTTFYGWGFKNRLSLSDWIIKSLRNDNSIECFSNVFFTPLYLPELQKIIFNLIKKNESGIFNVCSNERLSKFDFAIKIAKIFKLNSSLVKKSEFSASEFRVKRPLDLSLSNEKLKNTLNIKINSLEDQILDLKNNERNLENFFKSIY